MGSKRRGRAPPPPVGGNSSSRKGGKSSKIPPTVNHGGSSSSSPLGIILAVVALLIRLVVYGAVAAPCFVVTQSLSLVYGRPPRLVCFAQALRYWGFCASSDLSASDKVSLAGTVLTHFLTSPVSSLAWLLDEILYGRRLSSLTPTEQDALDHSLFVVSAFRSASTTLARDLVAETRYCEEASNGNGGATTTTPCFVAPNTMMCAYPYLWLWKLVVAVVGEVPDVDDGSGGLTKVQIKQKFTSGFSPETLARHPNDPFLVDTFDGSFLGLHLNGLAWRFCGVLPPPTIASEFNYAVQADALNRSIWEDCMAAHIDRLARKTLVFSSERQALPPRRRSKEGGETALPRQRFLLKGHFLSIAPSLQQRYPASRFLAVLRDPSARLKSGINYLAVNPTIFPPVSSNQPPDIPWEALGAVLCATEAQYCERELEWFGGGATTPASETDENEQQQQQQRLAVAFDSLVSNKDQTMATIVDWLELDGGSTNGAKVIVGPQPPSQSAATTKPPPPGGGKRKKGKKAASSVGSARPPRRYAIDKSLADVGIDETAYRNRLEPYLAWMKRVANEGGSLPRNNAKDKSE